MATYKNQRMLGQDPRDKGMYRFSGSPKKGTAQMHPDDSKVMVDIDERDNKDIDTYRAKGAKASKFEKMASDEAINRQNLLGKKNAPADIRDTGRGFAKGGSVKAKKGTTMKKMASGGSFRSSANGIAKKGKTQGKQIKMAGGGKMMASGGKMKGC